MAIKQHIFKSAGAPSTIPAESGHHYIDTTSGDVYLSKGFAAISDWVRVSVDPIIVVYTIDTTLTVEDVAIANSGSAINFTLPNATTYKKKITVKNSGAGVLSVLPTGGQLLDGLTDIQLVTTNSVDLYPKSGAWYIC